LYQAVVACKGLFWQVVEAVMLQVR
jgi:hypothetical protein